MRIQNILNRLGRGGWLFHQKLCARDRARRALELLPQILKSLKSRRAD